MSRVILCLVIDHRFLTHARIYCFPLTSNNYDTTSIRRGTHVHSARYTLRIKKLSMRKWRAVFSTTFYLRNYSSRDREGEARFAENRIENI